MFKKAGRILLEFLVMLLFLLSGFGISIEGAFAGAAQNHFFIGTSTDGYFSPPAGAAFDGTNYLVGMEKGRGNDGRGREISDTQVFQFISQSGPLVGSLISTGRGGGAPGVGFNGTNYLVAWFDDIDCDGISFCPEKFSTG